MKTKLGTVFIIVGFMLLSGALVIFFYNENEQNRAAEAVDELMPQIVEAIQIQQIEPNEKILIAPNERKMTIVDINGYGYIGFVCIPTLGLELPVMADWDYDRLKISPCRFWGSIYTDDIVIMAHNYKKHFGRLSQLVTGDEITFTDMEGEIIHYRIEAIEELPARAVGEMVAGDFDLTLFTCDYSGENRIAVRCDRIPKTG